MDRSELSEPSTDETYFSEMQSEVLRTIEVESKPIGQTEQTPVIAFWSVSTMRKLALAASIALLIGLTIHFTSSTDEASTNGQLAMTETEETLSEEEYLLAIEDDILFEVYAETMIEGEEDPLIEYILDNEFDINDLTNIN